MRVQIGSVVVETGNVAAKRTAPSLLPRRPASFTGREEELAEIVAQAQGELPPSVICLSGRPGVGKTALALEAAHRLRGAYPDGHLFAEVGTHSGRQRLTTADVLERFLVALDVAPARIPAKLEERSVLLRAVTRDRRVLLVVDDVVAAEDLALLSASPGCLLLATSRRALAGPGILGFALDGLRRHEAVALLTGAGADPEAAPVIADACGLLPLALRIAAARLALDPGLRAADLAEVLAEPDARLPALSSGMGDRAVRASFGYSYRALDAGARRFFRLLAALPLADVTAESAAVLTGADDAAERLRALADLHLLDVRDGHRGPRYRTHDLVALFCRELLGDEGRDAADRTAAWYAARTLEVHTALETGADPTEARHWYREEWDNLLAAGLRLRDRGLADPLWTLVRAVETDLDVHSPWSGWERLHRWGIEVFTRHGQWERARAMHERLALALREGMRMTEAFAEVRAMRALLPVDRRAAGDADADNTEGDLRRDEGDTRGALRLYLRAHPVLAARGDPGTTAWSLHGIADTLSALGHHRHALRLRAAELAAFRRAGDGFGMAWAHQGAAEAHLGLGDAEAAETALRAALRQFAELGTFKSEGWALERLAEVVLRDGREEEALVSLTVALRSYEARGNLGDQARALLRIGDIAHGRGRTAEAAALWRTAQARLAGLDGGRVESIADGLRSRLGGLTDAEADVILASGSR
ncbi:ATP-binding protein [Actinocorallia sp. API 0066]|uniref:NB-ARC domain-containing protein n=1 Tax=Actinocorallia sp. API 0066 TaxID=2896846 RepID=UPI001E390BD6|nr:NB-ARC domain-containing protein [Actinocorallia sp. API 0066]MCD0452676.1 ATP-binding protein [Actinocorallia sp. API 0066]